MLATQGLGLGPYGTAFALAVSLGIALAVHAGRARGYPRFAWMTVLGTALAAGIIGSKLVFLDFQPIEYGEKTILGGLLFGITATLIVARAVGIGAWRALDAMTVPTLSAMAVGRVGCFVAGCCAGTPTDVPWAVASSDGASHVHPAPLYEMAGDLMIIALLRRVPGLRADGDRFLFATLTYIGLRVAVETVRADRGFVGPLNVVQWALLALAIPLTIAFVMRRRTAAPPVASDRPASLLLLALVIAAVLTAAHGWFVPVERLALLSLSLGCAGLWSVAVIPSRVWRVLPFAPLAFAPRAVSMLVVQQDSSTSVTPRTEMMLGTGYAWGLYEQLVGREPSDGCTYGAPTYAERETRSFDGRVGIRRTSANGERMTFEGRYLNGRDELQRIRPGPVYEAPTPRNDINAGGVGLMWEGRRAMWRVDLLSGSLVSQGVESHDIAVTAAVRMPLGENFFLGIGAGSSEAFPTTGEFTQVGLGLQAGRDGPRVYSSVLGEGYKAEMTFPFFRGIVEASYRTADVSSESSGRGSMFRVGVTHPVRIR